MSPWVAKFLHVRRTELNRTLQVAGFAIVLGWAMYTAFSAAQSIFLNKAGPQAYPQPFRKEKGMNLCPPEPWELQLLEASLRAVPDYVAKHPADQPKRSEMVVSTAAGEVRMVLSWLVVAD